MLTFAITFDDHGQLDTTLFLLILSIGPLHPDAGQESCFAVSTAKWGDQMADEAFLQLGRLRVVLVHVRRDGQSQAFLFLTLFVEFLSNSLGPLHVDVVRLARTIDVGQFDYHLAHLKAIAFRVPIDAHRILFVHLVFELVGWLQREGRKNETVNRVNNGLGLPSH